MNRQMAEKQGRTGERIAAWWLRVHGWRIVGERIKTRVGEVDLIARRSRTLALVNVGKTTRPDLGVCNDRRSHHLREIFEG